MLGGLRPTSDLDVLVVVDRPTTEEQRRTLVERLLEISGRRAPRGPARPIELNIVLASEMRPWRHPPQVELLYGEWERDRYVAGFVPAPRPMADFAPVIVVAQAHGVPIFGPPPRDVLAPVAPADLRRGILEGLPFLLGDLPTDTRNVLLTLARGWFTLATGEIVPKDVAAAWAAERLPEGHGAVMKRAREMYLEGWDEEDWGERLPAARALADALVDQIRSAAPGEDIA